MAQGSNPGLLHFCFPGGSDGKEELPYDPAISTSGYLSEENKKTVIQKDTCTPVFIVALFTIARKQLKCPSIDEWKKMLYTCTKEYYSAIKVKFCHLLQHGWI